MRVWMRDIVLPRKDGRNVSLSGSAISTPILQYTNVDHLHGVALGLFGPFLLIVEDSCRSL